MSQSEYENAAPLIQQQRNEAAKALNDRLIGDETHYQLAKVRAALTRGSISTDLIPYTADVLNDTLSALKMRAMEDYIEASDGLVQEMQSKISSNPDETLWLAARIQERMIQKRNLYQVISHELYTEKEAAGLVSDYE